MVLRLAADHPAAVVLGVPAEVAAERRAEAYGGRVAGALYVRHAVRQRRLERCRRARGRRPPVHHSYRADQIRTQFLLGATALEELRRERS